jgi:hypothetical protein
VRSNEKCINNRYYLTFCTFSFEFKESSLFEKNGATLHVIFSTKLFCHGIRSSLLCEPISLRVATSCDAVCSHNGQDLIQSLVQTQYKSVKIYIQQEQLVPFIIQQTLLFCQSKLQTEYFMIEENALTTFV